MNEAYSNHERSIIFFLFGITGIAFYKFRLYNNRTKAFFLLPPFMAYFFSKFYSRLTLFPLAFDDIEGPMPYLPAQKERVDITNLCMMSDFSMTMKALKQEARICKPPADYIYSSLS